MLEVEVVQLILEVGLVEPVDLAEVELEVNHQELQEVQTLVVEVELVYLIQVVEVQVELVVQV
jgi:hypothetical protein